MYVCINMINLERHQYTDPDSMYWNSVLFTVLLSASIVVEDLRCMQLKSFGNWCFHVYVQEWTIVYECILDVGPMNIFYIACGCHSKFSCYYVFMLLLLLIWQVMYYELLLLWVSISCSTGIPGCLLCYVLKNELSVISTFYTISQNVHAHNFIT